MGQLRNDADMRGPINKLLAPSSILVVGPGEEASRTGRTLNALRTQSDDNRIAHVDSAIGVQAVAAAIDQLAISRSVESVLIYNMSPGAVEQLVPSINRLGAGLVVLGGDDVKGLPSLIHTARGHGIRILGPNGYGPFVGNSRLFINPRLAARSSGLGILAQSGNIVIDSLASMRHHSGLVPHFAWGLGYCADLGLADAVAAAAQDEACTAIAIHAEGFGEGYPLLRAVAAASRKKPVVLLQGGTSAAGSASALSHTGSLSTSRALVAGLFAQAGAKVVKRTDEFVTLGLAMSMLTKATANSVAVVADGGGQATLMMDALSDQGTPFANLSAATTERVRRLLGDDAHVANPVDVGLSPITQPTVAFDVVRELLNADEVDCVVVVGVIGSYAIHFDAPGLENQELEAACKLTDAASKLGKAVLFVSSYAEDKPPAYRRLLESQVPVVNSIDDAAVIVKALRDRAAFLETETSRSKFIQEPNVLHSTLPNPNDGDVCVLDEAESRAELVRSGLSLGPFFLSRTPDEASKLMEEGKEYVIKVVSPDISHKSDVGGVRLKVNQANLNEEYKRLLENVRANEPAAQVDGVSVAPMAVPGVEMIVGTYRDPKFGACLAVGSGGVLAELIRDTVIRSAPVTRLEATEMIKMTKSYHLLCGYRGSPPADLEGLVDLVVKVGQIVADHPGIQEIDLNPVIVSPTSAQVVDARVIVRATAASDESTSFASRERPLQVMNPTIS